MEVNYTLTASESAPLKQLEWGNLIKKMLHCMQYVFDIAYNIAKNNEPFTDFVSQ
jgi:hypothetical protein